MTWKSGSEVKFKTVITVTDWFLLSEAVYWIWHETFCLFQTKGELSSERKETFDTLLQTYQKLLANTAVFAVSNHTTSFLRYCGIIDILEGSIFVHFISTSYPWNSISVKYKVFSQYAKKQIHIILIPTACRKFTIHDKWPLQM